MPSGGELFYCYSSCTSTSFQVSLIAFMYTQIFINFLRNHVGRKAKTLILILFIPQQNQKIHCIHKSIFQNKVYTFFTFCPMLSINNFSILLLLSFRLTLLRLADFIMITMKVHYSRVAIKFNSTSFQYGHI